VAALDERKVLLCHAPFRHSYPHCWRHKTPIIFRATPQWFVSMTGNGLLAAAKSAVEDVQWIPDWGRARIDSMLAERPDWCISRQRTWGVPIALFVHNTTGEIHPDTQALMEQVAVRMESQGIDAWFDLDPAELLGDDAAHYEKVTDTLDVWFDSGVTHECVLREREGLSWPADLYLEGSDQHRGWFQSSLLTGIGTHNTAPYRQVLTHGFTVDGDGRKMSKSLGNIIPAGKAMQDLGADVLRLYVSAADYRNEISASDEIFKRTADAYRRIRNTARFLLANLAGFDPVTDCLPVEQLLPLDRWILGQAQALQADVRTARTTTISSTSFITAYITSVAVNWAASISISSKIDSTPRAPIRYRAVRRRPVSSILLRRCVAGSLLFSALLRTSSGRICLGPDPRRSFSPSGMTHCRMPSRTTRWRRLFGQR